MKQILLGDRIIVSDVPAPGVESGTVLVENSYSFISSGTESAPVKKAQSGLAGKISNHVNHLPRVLESIRLNGIRKTFFRVTDYLGKRSGRLGYSSVGRIVKVGNKVTDLVPGDLVACAGMGFATHSEVVAVPRNLVAKLPAGCDERAASGTTIAAIALQGVRRAKLQLGEAAAVVGLGLIGQITLQLLHASGVHVIGFDPNPWRVKRAIDAGFSDCHECVGGEALREVMLSFPNGVDATLITAATSTEGICQMAIEMTRKKGRVVIVGAVPLQFEREPFYRKEIDFLISCSYGPGRYDDDYELEGNDYPFAYVRWTENRNMQAVLKLIAAGSLNMSPLIDAEYPVSEAGTAFELLTGDDEQRPLGIVLSYIDQSAPNSYDKLSRHVLLPYSKKRFDGRVSLGIIGAGQFFTKTHLPNLIEMSDRYQIVAICSHTGSVAQDLARRCGAPLACTDPADLISDPKVDAVMICTRHDTHAELAMAALLAGKHVFVEKPLAVDQRELDDLVSTCLKSNAYLMTGFNRRFSPCVSKLHEVVQKRRSPLNILYRVFADQASSDSWIYTDAGFGRVIGESCHMFDFFNYLMGDKYEIVELDVVSSSPAEKFPPGDNFIAALRYEDGSLCTLVYTTLGKKTPDNGKERIEIMWDGKTCIIDDFQHIEGIEASREGSVQKGHREELLRFSDYLLGGGPEPISLTAMIRATEISFKVDSICRSQS